MRNIILIFLVCVFITSTVISNMGTLIFKSTEDYEKWRISVLLDGEVPLLANTPIPFSFAEKANGIAQLESEHRTFFSGRFSPQLILSNFEPWPRSGWYNTDVPEYIRYRYDSMFPWLELGFFTFAGDNLTGVINIDLRKDYRSYITHGPSREERPYTNLPVEMINAVEALELSWPSFGYASYGTEHFYASLGRTTLSWGPMRNGLALSDASQYYDNLSAAYSAPMFGSGNFTYTFNLISVISLMNSSDWERQRKTSDGQFKYWDLNQDQIYDYPAKHIIGHRMDFQVTPWLRLGLGELNVVGGKQLDLTDFNPFILYHNTYGEGYSNVMGVADFSVTVLPGLQFYGEFAMDDFAGPTEKYGARSKPMAIAFGGGVEYAHRFEDVVFSVALEGYHVDTWMYNRWQPLLTFTNRTLTKSEYPGARDLNEYPTGFKYGPDLNGFSVFISIYSQLGFTVNLEFDYFVQGEVNMKTPYLYMDDPSDEPGKWTDPEYWGNSDGEKYPAGIFKLGGYYDFGRIRIGGDFSLYMGRYFEEYGGYEKPVYEIRPFVSIAF
ncbi:MAG: Uncharacterized protein XE05_1658 [Thermotogales bacterium 46_20]|nr:MAG: Uncharacterized protein XE05_1658 [Thermotogales bacterium 46_20]